MNSQKAERPADAVSGALLQPHEPHAPIVALSAAKRKALLACLQAQGALHKCYGAWTGTADTRISGNTVADLAREGLLTITMIDGHASARLTERGTWFARTAAMQASASSEAAF
jgi:hypothetical protein